MAINDDRLMSRLQQLGVSQPWLDYIRATWDEYYVNQLIEALMKGDTTTANNILYQAPQAGWMPTVPLMAASSNPTPPLAPPMAVVVDPQTGQLVPVAPGTAPDPNATPAGGGGSGPGQTDVGGTTDQGKYSQAVDEAARSDPASFVGWILGQMGADQYGNNPLSASALRKATLTPYMRELQAGGYQNAPLYTYGDWLENWTKNNQAPGAAGGGNGTAFSFQQAKSALQGLYGRGTNPNSLEFDNLNGQSPQDALNNAKTYFAAGFADSLDPTYQKAAQGYLDRQYQNYNDSVFGGNAKDSFVDWIAKNGFNF